MESFPHPSCQTGTGLQDSWAWGNLHLIDRNKYLDTQEKSSDFSSEHPCNMIPTANTTANKEFVFFLPETFWPTHYTKDIARLQKRGV